MLLLDSQHRVQVGLRHFLQDRFAGPFNITKYIAGS